jgi:hypothetical protein
VTGPVVLGAQAKVRVVAVAPGNSVIDAHPVEVNVMPASRLVPTTRNATGARYLSGRLLAATLATTGTVPGGRQ